MRRSTEKEPERLRINAETCGCRQEDIVFPSEFPFGMGQAEVCEYIPGALLHPDGSFGSYAHLSSAFRCAGARPPQGDAESNPDPDAGWRCRASISSGRHATHRPPPQNELYRQHATYPLENPKQSQLRSFRRSLSSAWRQDRVHRAVPHRGPCRYRAGPDAETSADPSGSIPAIAAAGRPRLQYT